jgi:xanthine/CO dehydrogenase XdhC/CoxF family maturation factor
MTELRRILEELDLAERAGTSLLLATVVGVEGSTYRRPGARLLLSEERWLAGGVSGGCVEGDLLKRAFHRTAAGPVLVEYDTRTDDDAAWGRALGCNGLVEVWLERLRPGDPVHPLRTLGWWRDGSVPGVLATVLRGTPGPAGARLALDAAGAVAATIRDAGLAARVAAEARAALAARRSSIAEVEVDGGSFLTFVEYVPAPTRLLLFGEGHDVPPVVALARALGWKTIVVASRRTAAAAGPGHADQVVIAHPALLRERVDVRADDAALLMTHDFDRDRLLLAALLRSGSPPAYVGVLGPRRRTARLLEEIAAQSGALPADALARVHGPAGLDIGAEGPDEIALSIVAEIRAVLAGRAGGQLRASAGPIHERS